MLYLNQNDYPDMKYPTHAAEENHPSHQNSVADAGCGLCSACMMLDQLLPMRLLPGGVPAVLLTLEECRDLSLATGANWGAGTDMQILGKALVERFPVELTETDDVELLKAGLTAGACAILNPGGDYEGHIGIFTHGGHYIVAISYDPATDEFCILDPAARWEKFQEEGRRGKVRMAGDLVFTTTAVIREEIANRSPGIYLFRRR